MVRAGTNLFCLINAAVTRAISASVPTPVALSLAPGSCTCALNTNRSSVFTVPRALATTVSSVELYIFELLLHLPDVL